MHTFGKGVSTSSWMSTQRRRESSVSGKGRQSYGQVGAELQAFQVCALTPRVQLELTLRFVAQAQQAQAPASTE